MSEFDKKSFSQRHKNDESDVFLGEDDMLMEQILENINNTPIGQVLKRIASLPEMRRKKVLKLRRQITEGSYDLNERLDEALDRALEDITALENHVSSD